MASSDPQPRPQRGWQRGLVMAMLALALAWVIHSRERHSAAGSPPKPTPTPVQGASPLPHDAAIAGPAQSRVRLLALLPSLPKSEHETLTTRLHQLCGERVTLTLGDERVATALGIAPLPTFVLYGPAGKELKRLNGADALALLAAELQALGLTVNAAAEEPSP